MEGWILEGTSEKHCYVQEPKETVLVWELTEKEMKTGRENSENPEKMWWKLGQKEFVK